MRLGYVCTNFNSSSVTQNAVRTLCDITGHDISVVIVDNASTKAEHERLESLRSPCVDVLFLAENVGYFAGLNSGLRHLRERKPEIEWMIVGNNDLEFPEDFCDKLQHILPEIEKFPVVSPDIVTLDGTHQNPHVISDISKFREFVYDIYYSNYLVGLVVHGLARRFRRLSERGDEKHWQTGGPIYQGHGSAYILGPKFFQEFGELWAPTFMMSEEFFLSRQLSDRGYTVQYDPRVTIRHLCHGTLGDLPSRRRWELARDAHRVYRKYVRVL